MGLGVGESCKLIGLNFNFDLSSATLLELKLTDPDDVETSIDSSRITAPASDATFDENGTDKTYLANQYMQFTTTSTDFTTAGKWQIKGRYTNTGTTPDQIHHSKAVLFTVDGDY